MLASLLEEPAGEPRDPWGRAMPFFLRPQRPDADELYRAYYSRLVGNAMTHVQDRSTAEDVVQDAFMVLLGRWPDLDDAGKVRAWLFTVVRDRARAALRRQQALTLLPSENPDPGFLAALPSAEEEALANSEMGATTRVLTELPKRQRETLALALDGYTTAEIAGLLGITPNAVRVHLHQARTKVLGHVASGRAEESAA